ncbi:triose-phosphate isomerase [Microbacterium betulae]|uniref:Triosephosphate isomerase n=1 Tax=Microbacterium betulae TaxID=2981139 RepID=A0AA97FHX7_9MICO|nr:triose-phosphate isomerase family protein [Microbacterium sp. AB]WOF22389.1 triose-phosphate isomerase [Microbacterium sp. AB]
MTDERPGAGRLPVTLGVSLKAYLGVRESAEWAAAIGAQASAHPAVRSGAVEVFALPALPALAAVSATLAGSPVAYGAQDLFWEDRGPFTGAVSGADLAELGCRYVEIGHAERRAVFGEGEEVSRRKLAAAVRNGLTPVVCVGERSRQSAERAAEVCAAQLESVLAEAEEVGDLVIAYEPEWAIGRAEPAPPDHVVDVVRAMKRRIADLPVTGRVPVIYGGSAGPGLLATIAAGADGLFLGRFAHDPAAVAVMLDEAAAIR